MRKALKAALKIFGVLFLIIAGYSILLAHPEPLFSYSVTYSNISFFSNSPLSPQVARIASAVKERISASEIYDDHVQQRVFVIDKPWLWTFFNGPYRRAIARNYELGNPIFVPQLTVTSEQICHFDGRHAGAVSILAHESMHTFVEKRIGLLALWRLQWWQKEGYPEYIASKKVPSEAPLAYRQAALLWKCLIDERHLTFNQIIELRQSDTEIAKTYSCDRNR